MPASTLSPARADAKESLEPIAWPLLQSDREWNRLVGLVPLVRAGRLPALNGDKTEEQLRGWKLFDRLSRSSRSTYVGSIYTELFGSTPMGLNHERAALGTATDATSNQVRWFLQALAAAYVATYGLRDRQLGSFSYALHDVAFREVTGQGTIGYLPWFLLELIPVNANLLGTSISMLNSPGSVLNHPLRVFFDLTGPIFEFVVHAAPVLSSPSPVTRTGALRKALASYVRARVRTASAPVATLLARARSLAR